MSSREYHTKEEVLARGREAIGKSFDEIDATGRLSTGKGAAGNVMEESWFGYSPNSKAAPDFEEAQVELKVTPFMRTGNTVRAKERLVCNMIDFNHEYNQSFESSSFWRKCRQMLLMFYEYRCDVPKGEFKIGEAILYCFPDEDLPIIKRDYQILMDKIRAGKADLISEGDTMYLAACPKGRNKEDTREQPFSCVPAMKRAYSLKSSYMTSVLRRFVFGAETSERIIKDGQALANRSFEQCLSDRLQPYFGKSQAELKGIFGVTKSPKNLGEVLLAKMLGIQGKLAYTDEFQKAGIVPKTIRVNFDGSVTESMSFPTIDFCEIVKETWDESTLYEYLAPTKFLFVIFKEDATGNFRFQRIQFWNIPLADLEEVHTVWERTVATLRRGVKLKRGADGRCHNDLPKASENRVSHVRPHARDSHDTRPLPTGGAMPKQCFWLNNDYIAEQIR